MPFFISAAHVDTDAGRFAVDRLVASLWLNLLESRVPTLLGPRPFSVAGLLLALRGLLESRQLYLSTLSRHTAATLVAIERSQWLRRCARNYGGLVEALRAFAMRATERAADDCRRAVCAVTDDLGPARTASHLEFILTLRAEAASVVVRETSDLIADLIGMGHSESFLYGWGRRAFLAVDASERAPLRERLMQATQLGRPLRFQVAFQVGPQTWVPALPNLVIGRAVQKVFTKLEPLQVPEGHTLALAHMTAPDYKAAIEGAVSLFEEIVGRTVQTSRRKRLRLTGDRFLVRRDDTAEELMVPLDVVRPFEPPPLRYGVRTGYLARNSPAIVRPLEQCMYWLASAARVRDEAQFFSLWLALTSLLGEDTAERVAPLLAKYRTLALIETTSRWVLDYLDLGCRVDATLAIALRGIVAKGMSRRDRQAAAGTLIRKLLSERGVAALRTEDLLLDSRLRLLDHLMNPADRLRRVQEQQEDLSVLLPAARTARHGIAHLAASSRNTVALLNRALSEDVALVADQVAATGLGTRGQDLADVHKQTDVDFESLAMRTLDDPYMSIYHARQACCTWEQSDGSDNDA